MKPHDQLIAIAQACGYEFTLDHLQLIILHPDKNTYNYLLRNGRTDEALLIDGAALLPQYLTDLNAMHEAETQLTLKQWILWEDVVYEMLGRPVTRLAIVIAQLTATQRAEAFLRTLNLWTD